MDYKIVWSPEAVEDLESIAEYTKTSRKGLVSSRNYPDWTADNRFIDAHRSGTNAE